MTKIECYTENCKYNVLNKCNASIVSFDSKGNCLSRCKRDGGLLAQSFADIEAGEDYELIDMSSDIKCDNENCSFNSCCSCINDNIKVDDGMFKTCCITKQKRK